MATQGLATSAPLRTDSTAAAPPADSAAAQAVHFVGGVQQVLVARRYVGTVGGDSATAMLMWQRPDSVSGIFYYWKTGPGYDLGMLKRHSAGPVVLQVGQNFPATQPAGTWELASTSGLVLTGTWVDSVGHRLPVRLRESYARAVRYEIQELTLTGGQPEPADAEGSPRYTQEYLQLLGAAAQRPALRHLQAPPLAARRQQMQANYSLDATTDCGIEVWLNDFNLLSYQTTYYAMPFGGRPQPGNESFLVDLTTGQQLSVASQLQLGYEPQLRRFLTDHLLHDPNFDEINKGHEMAWAWQEDDDGKAVELVNLPKRAPNSLTEDDLLLTGDGLLAMYSPVSLYTEPGVAVRGLVLVPYSELRPLVRPGMPLARMLKARGMW
ncbi:MAG: hypothetical protein ACRYFV_10700 [Janthinobacterium lividum]